MATIRVPDYAGGSLLNLVGEIERRMLGTAPSAGLSARLAADVPAAATYVLVLFDGLGSLQLHHPAAAALAASQVGTIDAPFPTTTTVSLATVATGLPPAAHGLLGYQLWIPEVAVVVNTIKWTTLWGEPVDYDTTGLLPRPNLWERIRNGGLEPITVQPAAFEGTPLSRALYRGCRFEGVVTVADWVEAIVQLSATSGRLIFAYLPQVDFAAHVYGQQSREYTAAVSTVALAWEELVRRLPERAVAVGTADHGHIDFPERQQVKIARHDHEDRTFYGDGRAMLVRGEGRSLGAALPATWFDLAEIRHWWGPGPESPHFAERAPNGVLVADDDVLLLHRHSDDRMIGNHGALTDAERLVPLMVGPIR